MHPLRELVPDSVEWLLSLRTVEDAWQDLARGLLVSREINIVGAWMLARMRRRGCSPEMGWAALMVYRAELRARQPPAAAIQTAR